jgi:poly-beta-1,6-N-acetyl-D-glucosamine N-deacetylase
MTLISDNQLWKCRFFIICRLSIFNFFCGLFIAGGLIPEIALAGNNENQYLQQKLAVDNTENLSTNKARFRRNHFVNAISSSSITQVSNWLSKPQLGIKQIINQFAPYAYAYLHPAPFPYLHPKARLAKVPVIMYHDILPEKKVFFDVTTVELEQHFELIKKSGATPISLDLLSIHLRTGIPLPKKPVILSFDDGYGGHYQYVYPLLKKYNYPAVFAIYIKGVGNNVGRTHVSWKDLSEMVTNPLVTIASHSVTHPNDLRILPDDKLQMEILESKRVLESYLHVPINYFIYPVGKFDKRVAAVVQAGGYQLGLTMRDSNEKFAGESENLFAVERFGQSKLKSVLAQAKGDSELPRLDLNTNLNNLTTLLFISLFK